MCRNCRLNQCDEFRNGLCPCHCHDDEAQPPDDWEDKEDSDDE